MSKPAPWTPEQREAVRDVLDLASYSTDGVDDVVAAVEAALADHAPTENPEPIDVLVIGRTLERSRVLLSQVRRDLNAGPGLYLYKSTHPSADIPRGLAAHTFGRIYVEVGVPALVVDAARQHLARTGGVLVPLV